MKEIFVTLLFITSLNSFSQEKRVPTVVVLSPQETIIDEKLDSIGKSFERSEEMTEQQKQRIREMNGERFTLKSEKEIVFLEKMDLGSDFTFGLNFYLSFKLFEYNENNLVYPLHEKNNSTKEELNRIAESEGMNWVINIPKLQITTKDKELIGVIRYQLYNLKKDKIVIDEVIIATDGNPGFTFACKEGTINCVTNNLTSRVSQDVLTFINKNKNYWR